MDAQLQASLQTVDTLLARKEFQQAEKLLQDLLNHYADKAPIYNYFSLVFGHQAQYLESLAYAQKALACDPCYLEAYKNLGNLFCVIQEVTAGINYLQELYKKINSLPSTTQLAELFFYLGFNFSFLNQPELALKNFNKAVEICPNIAKYQAGKSMSLLSLGKLKEGFALFHWCYGLPQMPIQHPLNKLWDGSSLKDKTILLHSDQGFGDALMFVRYLPLVKKLAKKVILEVPFALVKIMQTMPEAENIRMPPSSDWDYDVQCPLMLLPQFFNTDLDSVPAPIPYLKSNVSTSIKIEKPKDGLAIGLVWAGSAKHANDFNRSCPVTAFEPLLSLPNATFYSLQMGERAWDQRLLSQPGRLISLADKLHDFADTAAVVKQLDLVISVDTAMVHLCGALGIRTWLLLPFAAEWRWMQNRKDSPWYPSLTLYRQPRPFDWPAVIQQVKADLTSGL